MKKGKILFIEDDNFLRKVYQAELKENGYEVVLSADGKDGINKAKLENPSLIILDMILPIMNGFEVLIALKNDKHTRKIPVLILSNLGQDIDKEKGINLGAIDYLVKDDTTLSIIVSKINEYINYRGNKVITKDNIKKYSLNKIVAKLIMRNNLKLEGNNKKYFTDIIFDFLTEKKDSLALKEVLNKKILLNKKPLEKDLVNNLVLIIKEIKKKIGVGKLIKEENKDS